MPHIHFNITDPRWAIVLAGAINNARSPGYKELNEKYTFSFEPTTDFMTAMANAFDPKPEGCEDYILPSEAQYPFIDAFQAQAHVANLFEQHGIKQDPIVVPLYLNMLATNSLLLTHRIASKVGYYVPKPTKQQLEQAPVSDVIIEDESMRELAKSFAEGYGISDPTIICCSDYSDGEISLAMFNTKVLVARPHHYSQYMARAQYRGFDFIHENIPVVSIIDNTSRQDNRYLVSWNGQIPVFLDDSPEVIKSRGRAWKIRKTYNFNHRLFYKDAAQNAVKE